jgi:hypothetical protein
LRRGFLRAGLTDGRGLGEHFEHVVLAGGAVFGVGRSSGKGGVDAVEKFFA